jgi:hypothetical protein
MPDKFVQTTLDHDLYHKLGSYAIEHDLTIKALVRMAIKKFLGDTA